MNSWWQCALEKSKILSYRHTKPTVFFRLPIIIIKKYDVVNVFYIFPNVQWMASNFFVPNYLNVRMKRFEIFQIIILYLRIFFEHTPKRITIIKRREYSHYTNFKGAPRISRFAFCICLSMKQTESSRQVFSNDYLLA